MNNIFRALNVTSEKEMNKFVESLNLETNDYINFMSLLNETLEPNTIRENLFKLTETLYNGSYEKLKEQCSKKPFKRKLKEDIEIEDNIKDDSDEEPEQKSSEDPEITKFINTIEKVVNNTTNGNILKGLLDSINSKIGIVTDVEQTNKLGELKQKAETKLMSSEKVDSISESIDYDEPKFEIGDNVEFYWGDEKYTGRVVEVKDRGTYELYNIISYNPETEKEETFVNVEPDDNLMKKISDDYEFEEYDDLDETCSAGATCAANVSGFAKPIGTNVKRKKKVKETFDSKLFKESILNEFESASKINGKQLKYFLNEGKYYMSVDNALVKSFNKNVMIETVDMILNNEDISDRLLEGYSCYEMNILMEDEDIFKKIGRIAGTYNVKTNDVQFLNPGEFHGDVDYENGIVRFGIQRINDLVKCYITAFDKGYAYKTYKFIKKYYKETPIDEFELEIINDDGNSIFIKYDDMGNQIFENKNVKHCDSKSIKKILESQDINYDYALHQSIINSIMEDVTANPLNPSGNEQPKTDDELKEPKNDEEQKYENDLKSKIGNTSEKYVVSSLDDENSVLNDQEIIGFDDELKKFILKGPDGKTMYSDSRNIKKINESVLLEGINELKSYYPLIKDKDFDMLVKLDPTYNGSNAIGNYGRWILNRYYSMLKDDIALNKWKEENKKGNQYLQPQRKSSDKLEDFQKLPNLLSEFDSMKNKLKTNIDNIKSIADLYSTINNAKNSGISTNKKVNKGIDLFKKSVNKGGKVVFKNNNWVILVPETLKSSVVFGEDTNWCTTASNGEMYNEYINEYGGKYFINLDLNTGSLYQFHFESDQFMNSDDNEVELKEIIKDDEVKKFYLNYLYKNVDKNKSFWIYILMLDDKPSEELQLEAVRQDGYAICFIDNPSEEVKLEAVRQDGHAIQFIKNPSEQVKLAAVKRNGYAIKYIKNPSEEIQLEAVKQNGDAIKYIDNPSEEVQLTAVKQNGLAIKYIKNPSEQVKLAAVKEDGCSIYYIKNPSEEAQLAAVRQDGGAIQYIDNPSEEVQLTAVKQDTDSMHFIKNLTKKVKEYVKRKEKKSIDESIDESIDDEIDKILKLSGVILTEGISDVAKYFPKLNIESIKNIIRLDPTYNGGDQLGKYSKWILRLVSNNVKNIANEENYRKLLQQYPDGINPKDGQPFKAPVRLPEVTSEDRYKIPQSLKKYDMFKEEIGKPIDAFKSLPELDAAISEIENSGVPAQKLAKKRLNIFKNAMSKGLKKVYEDNKWVVGIPETHESSIMFGDETSWCTTSKGKYYNYYSSQGPLFINLNKENGRLYQFHFQSGSFMNEHDSTYNWEDGGDIDGFFQDNLYLESFYKDYVEHETNPEKLANSIVNNKDRMDQVFEDVHGLYFDGKNITGTMDVSDINSIYRGGRNAVSLDFVEKVLNFDVYNAFDIDIGYSDLGYSDTTFDREIKKISQKGGVDLTNIKWDEIIDILKTEGSDSTEHFTEEEASKIYDKLTDDFYDNMGIWSVYSSCKTDGSVQEAHDDIREQLIDNLPLNKSEPFINETTLNISLPFEDLKEMLSQSYDTSIDNDSLWYERLHNSLDLPDGWLYQWYVTKHDDDSFGIYEPYYGWDGFDDSTWDSAISDLVHFIHVLKRGK